MRKFSKFEKTEKEIYRIFRENLAKRMKGQHDDLTWTKEMFKQNQCRPAKPIDDQLRGGNWTGQKSTPCEQRTPRQAGGKGKIRPAKAWNYSESKNGNRMKRKRKTTWKSQELVVEEPVFAAKQLRENYNTGRWRHAVMDFWC